MNYSDKFQTSHKYDDIINLPRHVSDTHPQMSPLTRAAQFSPFAALTGYDDAIRETARVTEEFVQPSQDRNEQLDRQLQLIRETLPQRPEIEIVYFQPDSKKDGGAYVTFRGQVKGIDDCQRKLLFTDGTSLPLDTIFSIQLFPPHQ